MALRPEVPIPSTLFHTYFVVESDSEFARFAREEFYQVHQFVCRGFSDRQAARAARILFRYDEEPSGTGCLAVQSLSRPDYSRFEAKLSQDGCKVLGPTAIDTPRFSENEVLLFRLLARPTKRVATGPDKGKRRSLRTEDEQLGWLRRKGEENGFRVDQVQPTDVAWLDSKPSSGGGNRKLRAVRFDGILTVLDPQLMAGAIAYGVGAQKGYGFGLLSVRHLASAQVGKVSHYADASSVSPRQ